MAPARSIDDVMKSTSRRSFLAVGGSAALSALGLSACAMSVENDAAASQVIDFDWQDPSRRRSVPVRLVLPNHATRHDPVPLVMFSHGIGGSRYGYSYLGRHWAANGVATLHVQHTGSDRAVWFDGSPLSVVDRLQAAARDQEAIDRVHDVRFALDQLGQTPMADAIDAGRVVMAGHSYGANTTLLAVGAQVTRQGQRLDLQDARFKAAIVISAPPFYGESATEEILASIQVPTLHITSTGDVINIPGYFSGAEDRIAIFEGIRNSPKALAVFQGGSHSMFTDRAGTGGLLLNPSVKTATRELTTAFLRSIHSGGHMKLGDWPARHAAILARLTGTADLLGSDALSERSMSPKAMRASS
jgi:predicted dienelactone hydrolase